MSFTHEPTHIITQYWYAIHNFKCLDFSIYTLALYSFLNGFPWLQQICAEAEKKKKKDPMHVKMSARAALVGNKPSIRHSAAKKKAKEFIQKRTIDIRI